MALTPSSLLADAPLPWRLTHHDRRRGAASALKAGADAVETALRLLDRALEILGRTPEPSSARIPATWMDYWDFTSDWLAEAMPELADVDAGPVDRLVREKGQPAAAEPLAQYFSWRVVADIGRSLLAWLRDPAVRSAVDPNRFVALAEHRWRGLDPWLASDLLLTAAEIAGATALPLLAAVANDSTLQEEVRDAARDFQLWIARRDRQENGA